MKGPHALADPKGRVSPRRQSRTLRHRTPLLCGSTSDVNLAHARRASHRPHTLNPILLRRSRRRRDERRGHGHGWRAAGGNILLNHRLHASTVLVSRDEVGFARSGRRGAKTRAFEMVVAGGKGEGGKSRKGELFPGAGVRVPWDRRGGGLAMDIGGHLGLRTLRAEVAADARRGRRGGRWGGSAAGGCGEKAGRRPAERRVGLRRVHVRVMHVNGHKILWGHRRRRDALRPFRCRLLKRGRGHDVPRSLRGGTVKFATKQRKARVFLGGDGGWRLGGRQQVTICVARRTRKGARALHADIRRPGIPRHLGRRAYAATDRGELLEPRWACHREHTVIAIIARTSASPDVM
ncbi:hypothetical protein OF83DRAFT_499304, partial [Amylostereum chailletii]